MYSVRNLSNDAHMRHEPLHISPCTIYKPMYNYMGALKYFMGSHKKIAMTSENVMNE